MPKSPSSPAVEDQTKLSPEKLHTKKQCNARWPATPSGCPADLRQQGSSRMQALNGGHRWWKLSSTWSWESKWLGGVGRWDVRLTGFGCSDEIVGRLLYRGTVWGDFGFYRLFRELWVKNWISQIYLDFLNRKNYHKILIFNFQLQTESITRDIQLLQFRKCSHLGGSKGGFSFLWKLKKFTLKLENS